VTTVRVGVGDPRCWSGTAVTRDLAVITARIKRSTAESSGLGHRPPAAAGFRLALARLRPALEDVLNNKQIRAVVHRVERWMSVSRI
jgi:hypothetical protein